jgi:hypothetical protein
MRNTLEGLGILGGILLAAAVVPGVFRFAAWLGRTTRYSNAQARFAARFCSHGIVDTGWCEECERKV